MAIDITGLDKADVLIALFYGARRPTSGPFSRGYAITREEAEAMLEEHHYFAYVNERTLMVDIGGDKIETINFDRENGHGAAEHALAPLIAAHVDRTKPVTQAEDAAFVRDVLSSIPKGAA